MTAQLSTDPVWSRRRDLGVLQQTWGADIVVYDPMAGSTHLLDRLCAAVLEYLDERDGPASAIARSLRAEFEADSEEDVLAAVRGTLAKLHDIHLVQSAAQ